MNGLTVINREGKFVVDSRDIATMIGKPHYDLIKSIKQYCVYLIKGNFPFNDFFIESTYQDSIGRTLPCYLITRKGCDMVANKMTGEKGVLFTATYVTKFEEMEMALKRKQLNPNFTPRMALDVAKFVSKELRDKQPNSVTLNILQEVFAQAGVNIPLDQYRKQAEEQKHAEEERLALSRKSSLQPGTIPAGPNRVKYLREARGWAQSFLAYKAGVSRVLISHTEMATKNTTQKTWEGICRAFEMPIEEVFPSYQSMEN